MTRSKTIYAASVVAHRRAHVLSLPPSHRRTYVGQPTGADISERHATQDSIFAPSGGKLTTDQREPVTVLVHVIVMGCISR